MSKIRGHEIEKGKDYSNCGYCGLKNTVEGHDGCLGTLPGVMNACCGHGPDGYEGPYVQFLDGFSVHGNDAVTIMKILKDTKEAKNHE